MNRALQHGLSLLVLVLAGCAGTAPEGVESPAGSLPPAPELPRLEGYTEAIATRFDENAAFDLVAAVDRFFRVRGNEGYQRSLGLVERHLLEGGFEASSVRWLALGPIRPTWTPRAARLELLRGDGTSEVLQAFDEEAGRDRATLLIGSDSIPPTNFEVVDGATLDPSEARGRVVLGRGSGWTLGRRWIVGEAAAGVLIVEREPYHERLQDDSAATFGYLPDHGPQRAFGFSLSPRSEARLREALVDGGVRVRVSVDVSRGDSAATALEATIHGRRPELPPVVLVAHVDEPGANDNASGVAALAELAVSVRRGIAAGGVPEPSRDIVLLWGQEMEVAREWLAQSPRLPAVGLVLDMVGQDPARIGSPFLIERAPDPGAVWLRPPDAHTGWGVADPASIRLLPHYLNDYVVAAAAIVVAGQPDWATGTNPYEGGSDHESFLDRGVPALLAWHFTDAAYHTSADRLERVSRRELRRVASVVGGAALGIASGRTADALEVLRAVEYAADWRAAAVVAGAGALYEVCSDPAVERRIAEGWRDWYDGALATVAGAESEPSSAELVSAIEVARETWRERAERMVAQVVAMAPAARSHCRGK